MQWWRNPRWQSLVEYVEDPSSARLVLSAAANDVHLYGNELDREHLAKACEAPAVIMAFHNSGDDESYPVWASDSLDEWERNTRTLVSAGVPEPLAAERAAMVFGTVEPHQDFIKAASNLSISRDDLVKCADSCMVEEFTKYVADPIGKNDWDESKVKRDPIGRFSEKDDSGVAFRVVGGRRVAIQEQVQVQAERKKPEKPVQRANTDEEILEYASEHAEERRKKAAQKRKKRIARAQRVNAVQAHHAQQQAAEQEKKRQEQERRLKATQVASRAGKLSEKQLQQQGQKAEIKQRRRALALSRMGRASRVQTPNDIDVPVEPTDMDGWGRSEGAKQSVDLGLTWENVTIQSAGSSKVNSTFQTGDANAFENPGVRLVTDINEKSPQVADVAIYMRELVSSVRSTMWDYLESKGIDPKTIPDKELREVNEYANGFYSTAIDRLQDRMREQTGGAFNDMYYAAHTNVGTQGEQDIVLIPHAALQHLDSSIVIDDKGGVTARIVTHAGSPPFLKRKIRVPYRSAPDSEFEEMDKAYFTVTSRGVQRLYESEWDIASKSDDDWDESEHKRDTAGRFATMGGQRVARAAGAGPDEEAMRRAQAAAAARRRAERIARVQRARGVQARHAMVRVEQQQAQQERVEALRQAQARQAAQPQEPAAAREPEAPQQYRRSISTARMGQRSQEARERDKAAKTEQKKQEWAQYRAKQARKRAALQAAAVEATMRRDERLAQYREHAGAETGYAMALAERRAAQQQQIADAKNALLAQQKQTSEQRRVVEQPKVAEQKRVVVQPQEQKQEVKQVQETKPTPVQRTEPYVLPKGVSKITKLLNRFHPPEGTTRIAIMEDGIVNADEDFDDVLGGFTEPGEYGEIGEDLMSYSEGRDFYDPETVNALREVDQLAREGHTFVLSFEGQGTYEDPYKVDVSEETIDDEGVSAYVVEVIKSAPKRKKLRRL